MAYLRALALLLCLTACGFTPVNGPGGAGAALQNRVLVDPPRDEAGFQLVQRIEERLGRAADPAYRLAVTLDVDREDRAIDPDGDIRRFHLVGKATYSLWDAASSQVIETATVDSFVAYSATGTTVATLAAQRDAQARLMTILADEIVLRLQTSDL